jgi:hypothetical protein
LGSAAALFADAGTGAVVDLSSDFTLSGLSAYGSNPSTLYFGVFGTQGSSTRTNPSVPGFTVYVGSGDGTVPQRQSNQNTLEGNEVAAYNEYRGNDTGSGYASASTGDAGSYTTVAGSDGFYQGNFSFATQDLFSGSGTQTLALYEVAPGTGNSTKFGTLALNDTTGSLIFTATTAPEPSTYALMGLGLGFFAFVMRRRLANNA